jgi:DNA mismatch endonuclease, patch repair protein
VALELSEYKDASVIMAAMRDPKIVSYTMSRIRGKDTTIELRLRRALWEAGYRYRLHVRNLPGTPDIVFLRPRVAVFCDSSFWHGRNWAEKKSRLVSRREYWIMKIERNIARDIRVSNELSEIGWRVLRFWDVDIEKRPTECVREIAQAIGKLSTKDHLKVEVS